MNQISIQPPGLNLRGKPGADVLFSLVHSLGDEESLSKLNDRGIQLTPGALREWANSAGSAEELVRGLLAQGLIKSGTAEDDLLWIWAAIAVLWERWLADSPSFEMLDARIGDGYEREDRAEGCREWLQAWLMLLRISERLQIGTLREFDERFRGTDLAQNWVQDLEMELGDLARPEQNRDWFEQRARFCQEFLSRFPQDDRSLVENMRSGLAESLFGLGETVRAERLYRNWLEENPQWNWGWISWADCHLFAPAARRDAHRAEEILLQGMAIEGIDCNEVFYERLEHLYKEQGQTKKAAEMQRALDQLNSGSGITVPQPVRKAGPKIGRNDPCPCGSGKKFKKCGGGQ